MDLINLKSVGIDPVKVESIQENALTVTKQAAWFMLAINAIVSKVGALLKVELPPPPQG